MKVTYDLDLNTFEAWSGAVDTLEKVRDAGKVDELEFMLEDLYPDGIDETQLNDLLWFEYDWIFESLGIRTESEIKEEIENLEYKISEIKEEIEDIFADFSDECIGVADWERKELWKDNYKDSYDELKEQLAELEEGLKELEEELEK